MAHAHNLPKSEQKPYFTDYTVAGTDQGRIHAAIKRAFYWQKQDVIRVKRRLRLDNRFWDTRLKPHPVKVRGGFPTKREIDYSLPSKKGQPKALNQFKVVSKLISTGEESMVWVTKIFQLHATRGWKVYA